MSKLDIYFFLGISQIFYLLSFIFSFRKRNEKSLPEYLKGFYVYPLIGLIIIVFFWLDFLQITAKYFYINLNRISLLFHFAFLSSFSCKALKLETQNSIERILFWVLFIILIGIECIDFIKNRYLSFSTANIFLLLFCINYYNKLFRNSPSINLIQEPAFWIITGIFLGMGTIIPFSFFNPYLSTKIPINNYYLLVLMAALGYSIMHLLFIKAFLCKSPQLKS